MPNLRFDAEQTLAGGEATKGSRWSIRVLIASTGERMVFLLRGRYGLPEPLVARYSVLELRARNLAWRSMRNTLEGVARGIDILEKAGAGDLEAFVATRLLSSHELSELANLMRLRKKAPPDAETPSAPLVRASAHYSAFIEYLLWLHEEACEDHPRPEAMAALRMDFRQRAARKQPSGTGGHRNRKRLGLTKAQRDLFQRIIVPGAPGNPFQYMAERNFVILNLSFNLGMRSGELLGLRIQDFTFTGANCRVTIAFSPDDVRDTRKRQPGQKTRGRQLPLTARTARSIEYLIGERRKLPLARTHPYLFVNRDGAPLGQGGFGLIFESLRKAEQRLADLINHILRHDWNDRWREMVEEKGWDLAHAQDLQTAAMGWRPNSKMPTDVYGQRSLGERSDASLIAMQLRNEQDGASK